MAGASGGPAWPLSSHMSPTRSPQAALKRGELSRYTRTPHLPDRRRDDGSRTVLHAFVRGELIELAAARVSPCEFVGAKPEEVMETLFWRRLLYPKFRGIPRSRRCCRLVLAATALVLLTAGEEVCLPCFPSGCHAVMPTHA